MGNPSIPPQVATGAAESPSTAFNGILARVPGDYISDGARQLPPASKAEEGEPVRAVTLEVPHLGAVRITYDLNSYRHRRSRYWHWLAKRADLVEQRAPGMLAPMADQTTLPSKPGQYLYHDAIGGEPVRVELRETGEQGLGVFYEGRDDYEPLPPT